MASTSEIRKGLCFEHNNDIWIVKEFQHVKPGKGAAFVRMKYKSITNGRVIETNIPAGHDLKDVKVEHRNYSFLYNDCDTYHFMNNDTFEQAEISADMLENTNFLKEGDKVQMIFHAEKDIPLTVELAQSTTLEVTYIEPGLKGDTATNAMTPATVETGATVRVPMFIKQGDLIKVDPSTGEYIERVKK